MSSEMSTDWHNFMSSAEGEEAYTRYLDARALCWAFHRWMVAQGEVVKVKTKALTPAPAGEGLQTFDNYVKFWDGEKWLRLTYPEFEKRISRANPAQQPEATPALTLDLDALAMVLLDRAVKEENLSPNEDSSFWYPWSECNEACRDDWRREAQDLLAAVEAKRQANLGTPANSGKDVT